MKKLFKPFALCLASAAMLTACSSDEPANTGNQTPEDVTGMDAYIQINIKSAEDFLGRADGAYDAADGFTYGTAGEHAINNAKFYFFDANGLFTQEATLLNFTGVDGTDSPDVTNVEYMGKNKILVLKGLTTNTTPNYLLTVLNAPAGFTPGTTLSETRAKLTSIFAAYETTNYFIMSTSSYSVEGKEYGVNTLTPADFLVQPAGTVTPEDYFKTNTNAHAVDVYVERLAAKIQVSANGIDENGYIKLNYSVAGNDNDKDGSEEANEDEGQKATLSEIYIKLSNWAINGAPKQSYLTKDITMADDETFADWNSPSRFRSYWGKSVLWGIDATAENANFVSYSQAEAAGKAFGDFDYCAENTNTLAKIATGATLNNPNITSVIFTGQVFEKKADGTYAALDMVRYAGALYRTEWFLDYVLNNLNHNNKLNYYKRDADNDVVTKDEEGNVTNTTLAYKQLDRNDLALSLVKEGAATGTVIVKSNVAAETVYYVKGTNAEGKTVYTETKFDTESIAALNAALKSFDNTTGAVATANAYDEGKMFYSIPVEHLVKRANTTDDVAVGNYGVVRNHWYQITVTSISNLGHGVFNPGEGTEDQPGEPLIPDDPQDPTYFLGATINILSWKIVNQNVIL